MARFHLRFKDFKAETLEATETLFAAKPWDMTEDEQQAVGQAWLDAVAPVYEVPSLRLVLGEHIETDLRERRDRRGDFEGAADDPLAYVPPSDDDEEDVPEDVENEPMPDNRKVLVLQAWSILILFKSFRDHMLNSGVRMAAATRRDDLHGWACSLYYKVRPIQFRKLVREGRIKRIAPDELLSSATLEARRIAEQEARQEAVRQEIAAEADAPFEDIEEPSEETPVVGGRDASDAEGVRMSVHNRLAGTDVTTLNTRPLRKYVTQLGMQNTWDLSKPQILDALRTVDEYAQAAYRLLEAPRSDLSGAVQ